MVAPAHRTKPHDVPPMVTGGRHCPNPRRGAEEILKLWERDPHSRILCIAAKCIQCAGSSEAVRICQQVSCALHAIRPHQYAEPKAAPHCRRFDETTEPGGLDDDEETAEASD